MQFAGQLSAFAAAKLARQSASSSPALLDKSEPRPNGDSLAAAVAAVPYDGHHSGATTSRVGSIEDGVIATPSSRTVIRLSTFRPSENNVVRDDDQCLELGLQLNETATFIGEYDFTVLSGIATIYGCVLRPNSGPRRVYAPSTHALPQIQARQDCTTVRIQSVKSSIRKLEKLSPLFRSTGTGTIAKGSSFAFLNTTEDDALQRSLTSLEIDREFDTVLRILGAKASVEPRQPRIMAVGAKSAGKSTLNRILCNHLYSWTEAEKCIYLDLDPGQPEFGPPGQVSIVEISQPVLGPPVTHAASMQSHDFRIIRSHTIAATSYKEDPDHYKACARDLARHIDNDTPLIANSCGWVSGLGATVLVELVSIIGFTDVVLLQPLESGLIDSLQAASTDTVTFHSISRRGPKSSPRTPAESRAMQTMAYFHQRPSASRSACKWSGKAISQTRPWRVSYAGSDPGIFAILSYGQSPHPDFLAEVLDGSIIAVVVLDEMAGVHDNQIHRTPEEIPFLSPSDQGISPTLDPKTSQCAGLALIRGIDINRKQIHLVTPIPESQIAGLMEQRVILVRGSFDSPEWAYLEDLYKSEMKSTILLDENERPWVSGKEMPGIEGAVWRLRHPPMASAVTLNR